MKTSAGTSIVAGVFTKFSHIVCICGSGLAFSIIGCADADPGSEQADATVGSSAASLSVTSALTAVHSGLCVEVVGSSTANGAKLQQAACDGASNQKFQIRDRGNGQHELVGSASGKCLDVKDRSTANGAAIQQWSCSGTSNQLWTVIDKGNSQYQLKSVLSGKCLDVAGVSLASGAALQQWSCGGGKNQLFALKTVSPDGSLTWKKANLTNFTSYPDPGSDECINYNGCTWAGYFAGVEGKQTLEWVKSHNIAAVHEKDFGNLKLKTLRLKQGTKQIDVTVYDECADSDCSGCCTNNANQNGYGFLIDVEKFTMQRFGTGGGTVEWACLDCK